MARYPGAAWRPVTRYQPGVSGSIATRMSAHRRYGLHTAVSSARSLFNWFNVRGRATSHFYIAADGYCEQYIDTAYRSTAHLQGNHDTVTVESQDMGSGFPSWSGSNVPAWSSAQLERLADLGAWLHKTHGIRIAACPNSRPGSLGFSYHRQGIDPWRVSGGEYWSKATGKVCPGDRRVAQVPIIIARAKAIAGGASEEDEVRPSQWNAEDDKAVRQALHKDNRFAGHRDNILSGKAVDWHAHVDTLNLEYVRQKLDVLVAAHDGGDVSAILQHIDAHHDEVLAQLKAAEDLAAEPKTHAREVFERVGFTHEALDIALGVAFAESGGFADAVGDLGIVTAKWGPSIGLFQVRSLRDPMAGNEADRYRIAFALRDPDFNAVAAFAISAGGTDWSPWTTFRNGTHVEHVGKDFEIATGHERADQWNA